VQVLPVLFPEPEPDCRIEGQERDVLAAEPAVPFAAVPLPDVMQHKPDQVVLRLFVLHSSVPDYGMLPHTDCIDCTASDTKPDFLQPVLHRRPPRFRLTADALTSCIDRKDLSYTARHYIVPNCTAPNCTALDTEAVFAVPDIVPPDLEQAHILQN
jgi:hypothetical protein